ncbi:MULTISPECIES: HEAT repeat domain-containing protein [Kitasatospora]|uniref:HEAT repeat protein n=1 Tax=Kitasatospora cystarginea TaxID=58350 RepID=A0ABN3E7G6_9ACTN
MELVRQALATARDAETTGEWGGYEALLRRAAADGQRSLRLGLELIGSGDRVERATGCDLLGHASDQDGTVRAATVDALVALAEHETDPDVLWSLARAIELTYDQRAVPVLVSLAGHPDAEVRRRAAISFAGVSTDRPDGPDIRALVELTRDDDPEVRNWATFTLGFQICTDSPAIRSALWERTADEHMDTREEGIHGLARRHDPRAVPLLAELLDQPEGAHHLTFSAAQIMGSPELLPYLLDYDPGSPGVTEAVHACDPVRRARLDASAWDLVCELHRLRPDLGASVSMERFDPGLSLGLATPAGPTEYSVPLLLDRADGDPARAAGLVSSDFPAGSDG